MDSAITATPRKIPLILRSGLSLGGYPTQFAWLFLGLGLLFFWQADAPRAWKHLLYFAGDTKITKGRVLATDSTNMTIYQERVYHVEYRFVDETGNAQIGSSFTTDEPPTMTSPVLVEYVSAHPKISRIKEMAPTQFVFWSYIAIIFPLAGLALVLHQIRRGIHAARLLRHGRLAYGRLVSKEKTESRAGQNALFKLIYEYSTEDSNKQQMELSTSIPQEWEAKDKCPIIYDPAKPGRQLLLDNLPFSPVINANGALELPTRWHRIAAASALLIPLFTIATAVMFLIFL